MFFLSKSYIQGRITSTVLENETSFFTKFLSKYELYNFIHLISKWFCAAKNVCLCINKCRNKYCLLCSAARRGQDINVYVVVLALKFYIKSKNIPSKLKKRFKVKFIFFCWLSSNNKLFLRTGLLYYRKLSVYATAVQYMSVK